MINEYARYYCADNLTKIENYDKAIADESQVWHCHHRLETNFADGTERPINARLSKDELIALDAYYNRPAEELIFMTKGDHRRLHLKGIKLSDEEIDARNKVRRGENTYGKTMTKEDLRKIEIRIINRIKRNSKVLYKDKFEEATYNYLIGIQKAKEELIAKLAAKGIFIK